ncbi:MAG: hypothetical protein BWY74_02081 [Firmicutes bacterium ADurb.Bin419]|nr:MAG: hypothetical protein BWY74_02081 [Firmicutes bacterium ADurb.Bin419]
MYEERVYRGLFKGVNLKFFDVCIEETDLMIGATKELNNEALLLVKQFRSELEEYIRQNPEFLTALQPVEPSEKAPYIIKKMCDAAYKAGVGPMAAVAGAVSELTGMGLLKYSDEIIVENGGDIFIKTNSKRKVGIYAGKSPLSEKIAIEIEPERTPMGICTSSGTVGHSLSFGRADAAVILARDTFLSDAVATATGNRVKNPEDIDSAIEFASRINGVEGVLIIIGDKIGAWGDIKLTSF